MGDRFGRIAPAARVHQDSLPRKVGLRAGVGGQRCVQFEERRFRLALRRRLRARPPPARRRR
jgi:hypothetical protein